MELVYIITKKDVGLGVFNNRFGSKERTLLVSIHHKFGGLKVGCSGYMIDLYVEHLIRLIKNA